ncbi:YbbN family protein [Litchfieldia alkalitelluris]|uniref:glutaredoxin family protein n=1 Tax=Litchfieldia alkalitelluris TaxID=304268 RepID=UPI0009982F05|nr:thioredoxin family protein [Litchfieldia alkalitelluris]
MGLEIIKLEKNDCPGCKILGIILENEVDYPIKVVNLDQSPELNEKYSVLSVPVLIFENNGVEVERLTEGTQFNGEKINNIIDKYKKTK